MEKKMLKFYGYKRCSTCRKGEKLLAENSIAYEFIDITTAPPSRDELELIVKRSGKPLKKFFNTSGVRYRELNMKEKVNTLTESEILDLLASDGKLIKRPLLTDEKSATVAYNEDEFRDIWI